MSKLEHHKTILGFESFTDLAQTLFAWKSKYFMVFVASLGGFISKYIYENENAVYFMLFLLLMDLLTAVYRSIKTGTFTSKRLPRILVVCLSYCLMLAVATNAAKYSVLYSFLPGVIYTGFITVLIISIAENLMQSNLLPKNIFYDLKNKLDLKKIIKKKNDDANKKEN